MLKRLLRFLNENNLSDDHVLLTYNKTTHTITLQIPTNAIHKYLYLLRILNKHFYSSSLTFVLQLSTEKVALGTVKQNKQYALLTLQGTKHIVITCILPEHSVYI